MLADSSEPDDFGFGFGPWAHAEQRAHHAFELYEDARYPQALEELNQALEVNPANSSWHFNKALTLDALGRFDDAVEEYKLALEMNPQDPEILNALAVDYTRCGFYDLAIDIFEQIESVNPRFEPAYCNRIITYTEMDKHDLAEQMFYLAQQINPDCPLCYYNIGNSFFAQANYKKAQWCWEKTRALEPTHPQINYRIAQACWADGDYDAAARHFSAELCQSPGDVDVIFDFGLLLLQTGKIESAREKFNRVLELAPDLAAALYYLGEIIFNTGDYEHSSKLFLQALEKDRCLMGPRYRLAQCALQSHQTVVAVGYLVAELSLQPDNVDILLSMGSMFLELVQLDHAVHCFLRVIDQDERNADAFHYLGLALAMRGEFQSALEFLERAVYLKPENAITLKDCALAYLELGRLDEAVAKIDAAYALSCRFGEARPQPVSAGPILQKTAKWLRNGFHKRNHPAKTSPVWVDSDFAKDPNIGPRRDSQIPGHSASPLDISSETYQSSSVDVTNPPKCSPSPPQPPLTVLPDIISAHRQIHRAFVARRIRDFLGRLKPASRCKM